MSCPHCLSTSISKRKRRTSLGYRTFYCRDCGRRFNERSGTPFNDLQFPTDIVRICQNSVLDPVLSRRNGIKHWHTENESTGMYGRVRY